MNIQIIANIISSFGIYLILSLSFSIIYKTSKFFHIAHAIVITFAAYFLYFLTKQLNANIWFSIILSIISATLIGLFCEILVYKPLRSRNATPFMSLVLSLGIYIILQNIISLIWNDSSKTLRMVDASVGNYLFGAYITNIQLTIIGSSIILFLSVFLILNQTRIGTKIRAVSSNANLAVVFGINFDIIIRWTFIIGSILASIAGILIAYDTSFTPTMGFRLLLFGIIAMIIGGVESLWGLIFGSLLLAIAQHIGAYYLDSKWMDAIAYIILIIFLICKPLGFSGKRLKKIEI